MTSIARNTQTDVGGCLGAQQMSLNPPHVDPSHPFLPVNDWSCSGVAYESSYQPSANAYFLLSLIRWLLQNFQA